MDIKALVRTDTCGVPGCTADRTTEDCCHAHGLNKGGRPTLPNDGVLDWIAIDIAVEGSREVRLTWIEWDIAAATILANGLPASEVATRLGRWLDPTRGRRVEEIAEAIRKERLASQH